MKMNKKIIRLKIINRPNTIMLLVLTIILSLFIIAVPMAGIAGATNYYVDPTGTDDTSHGTGTGTGAFKTIQYAINDSRVVTGDTINVAAGTYNPVSTIVIDKNNLTLNGPQASVDPRPSYSSTRIAGSANEAVIDGGGTLSNIILIKENYVVINGFEIKSGKGDMIVQNDTYTDTVVKYNIIHDGLGDEGVQLKKCTNGVLEYNYVYDIAFAGDALNFANSVDCYIRYNEVYNIGSENAAIYVYGSVNTTIEGNLVDTTSQNDGIKMGNKGGNDATKSGGSILDNVVRNTIQDCISVYMSDVLVQGNEVSGSTSENGAIYLAWGISNISITENNIYGNTLATGKWGNPAGILIGTEVNASTVTINNNDIYNNYPNGVTNKATANVNATNNWWGDASGPTHSSNSGGNGDAVSDNVDYNPWYTDEGMTTLSNADATLSDLTVDGTTISGFDSSTLIYNKVLSYGTTESPQ